MSIFDLSEQEIIRRNSLNELRNMGIDPYPAAEYKVDAYTTEIYTLSLHDALPIYGQGFVYGNSGQQGPHSSVC